VLLLIVIGEGGGDVPAGVEDSPDVDIGLAPDVEDEIGEAGHRPGAKLRGVES
jgi:hypothetical protein